MRTLVDLPSRNAQLMPCRNALLCMCYSLVGFRIACEILSCVALILSLVQLRRDRRKGIWSKEDWVTHNVFRKVAIVASVIEVCANVDFLGVFGIYPVEARIFFKTINLITLSTAMLTYVYYTAKSCFPFVLYVLLWLCVSTLSVNTECLFWVGAFTSFAPRRSVLLLYSWETGISPLGLVRTLFHWTSSKHYLAIAVACALNRGSFKRTFRWQFLAKGRNSHVSLKSKISFFSSKITRKGCTYFMHGSTWALCLVFSVMYDFLRTYYILDT